MSRSRDVTLVWERTTLAECVAQDAPICYGILKPGKHVDGGVPVIKVRDLKGGSVSPDGLLHTDPAIDRAYKRSRLAAGDLLLAIRGSTGTVAEVPASLAGANITQDTARIRSRYGVNRRFLKLVLESHSAQRFIKFHTIGQAVKGINIRDVRRIPVTLPPQNVQAAIAETLDAWSVAVDTLGRLLAAKIRFKRGVMQQLLTGKRRFKQFSEIGSQEESRVAEIPPEWDVRPLRDVFESVTRRNAEGVDLVLTASGQHGMVDQRDFFDRSVAGADLSGYYLLERGEFAYNRSSMNGYPFGAIKRLDDYPSGAVSTLYICFGLKSRFHEWTDYFAHLFESGFLDRQLRRVVGVGGRAHGLLNVTKGNFFGLEVPVPPKMEQGLIAALLDALQREIDLLEDLRDALDRQRRGVTELLLTGKVRVPA